MSPAPSSSSSTAPATHPGGNATQPHSNGTSTSASVPAPGAATTKSSPSKREDGPSSSRPSSGMKVTLKRKKTTSNGNDDTKMMNGAGSSDSTSSTSSSPSKPTRRARKSTSYRETSDDEGDEDSVVAALAPAPSVASPSLPLLSSSSSSPRHHHQAANGGGGPGPGPARTSLAGGANLSRAAQAQSSAADGGSGNAASLSIHSNTATPPHDNHHHRKSIKGTPTKLSAMSGGGAMAPSAATAEGSNPPSPSASRDALAAVLAAANAVSRSSSSHPSTPNAQPAQAHQLSRSTVADNDIDMSNGDDNSAMTSIDGTPQPSTPSAAPTAPAAPASSATKATSAAAARAAAAKLHRIEPTFISSRTFAPLSNSDQDKNDAKAQPAKEGGMKRMGQTPHKDDVNGSGPRSSPMRASTSSSSAVTLDGPPNPAQHPARRVQQLLPTAPLPFQRTADDASSSKPTVPTYLSSPRYPPNRSEARLFELEDCPTFYPTWEEFADPMRYIDHISSPEGGNGKAYGIVKVVPPEGWHSDFVLDQERFRFRTRVQQLNELSADARALLNYEEQLQKFHSQQGRSRVSIPVIDRRPVNLYQLKLLVKEQGGPEAVTKGRKWADLARALGWQDPTATAISGQIKAAYMKVVHPFEQFLAKVREQQQPSSSSSANRLSTATPDTSLASAGNEGRKPTTQWGQEMLAAGSSLEEVLQAEAENITSSKRRSARRRTEASTSRHDQASRRRPHDSSSSAKVVTLDGAEEQMCEICLRGDDGTSMLLCDDCNRGYHMYCLDPPLTAVPKSQWFCPPCLVGTGNDYGFDDGETHSLDSFFQRASAFRSHWFKEKDARDRAHDESKPPVFTSPAKGVVRPLPGTHLQVSEDDVEREFWRLVHNPNDTVEVEYGADVHSTTHGSAMPTLETHPLNPHSRDGWNLNNLPILPQSLLRYIKSDISGMTVPWIYVGMMFSTFCWHNEDHYTYSINYQHFGDTKTWYGIPGADAEKFEDAMRKAAPDLFETSPDLLFQLVTMMSPDKLKKEGVRVYSCDQRANEFVVTYPKAYHSGFNHGFNLNEAVNFALPDWIGLDLECVQRYQRFSKAPVFSHDELVITASQHSTSIETASWLQHPYKEMVARELAARNSIREDVPGVVEEVDDQDRPESEYQCAHCSCFCYLSQITSPKASGVACLEHAFKVCGLDSPSNWTMRLRYFDEHLQTSMQKIVDRAELPVQWRQRFMKLLTTNRRPPLKSLRSLLAEGEKMPFHLPEIEQLREFVDKANDWVQQATKLMPKRHGARLSVGSHLLGAGAARRGTGADSPSVAAGGEGTEAEPLRSREAVDALLVEVEKLPFDAPEITALREAVVALEDVAKACNGVLDRFAKGENVTDDECKEVLATGAGFNVAIPELDRLKRHIEGRKWLDEMDEIHNDHINLIEVKELLAEFEDTDLPVTHHHYRDLQQRLIDGEQWEKTAGKLLEDGTTKTFEEIEYHISTPNRIPVVPEYHIALEKLRNSGLTWQKAVKAILDKTTAGHASQDLAFEARKVVEAVRKSRLDIPEAKQLSASLADLDDWRKEVINPMVSVIEQTTPSHTASFSATTVAKAVDVFCQRVARTSDPSDDIPLPTLKISRDKEKEKTKMKERAKELAREGSHDDESSAMEVDQADDEDDGVEKPRQCVDRVPFDEVASSSLKCNYCLTTYHAACLKGTMLPAGLTGTVRSRGRPSAASANAPALADWTCPFCNPSELPALVRKHRGVDLEMVEKAMADPKYVPARMRFKPKEWDQLREAGSKAYRLRMFANDILNGPTPSAKPRYAAKYQHLLARLLGCPFNINVTMAAAPIAGEKRPAIQLCKQMVTYCYGLGPLPDLTGSTSRSRSNSALPAASPSAAGAQASSSSAAAQAGGTSPSAAQGAADLKRKRGKRAKLVFREEVGIWVPLHGERIYCLCHTKETGAMISCDRCMLWFHNKCVHITDVNDLGGQKWHCPMCCVKTERKYPHAEVKVKDIGVSQPDMWLDIRSSLRSNYRPISKKQHWSVPEDKRIVLHLESFYPAIAADNSNVPPEGANKRQKRDSTGEANAGEASVIADDITAASPSVAAASSTAATKEKGKSSNDNAAEPIVISSDDEGEPGDLSLRPAAERNAGAGSPSASANNKSRSSIPGNKGRAAGSPSGSGAPSASKARPAAAQQEEADRKAAADERHRIGMANLYSRGVTDAMIQKWYVGWNGRTLVYPRYDASGRFNELDLGPRISLAPDDPDGTRLIESLLAMERREHEQREAAEQVARGMHGAGQMGAPVQPQHGHAVSANAYVQGPNAHAQPRPGHRSHKHHHQPRPSQGAAQQQQGQPPRHGYASPAWGSPASAEHQPLPPQADARVPAADSSSPPREVSASTSKARPSYGQPLPPAAAPGLAGAAPAPHHRSIAQQLAKPPRHSTGSTSSSSHKARPPPAIDPRAHAGSHRHQGGSGAQSPHGAPSPHGHPHGHGHPSHHHYGPGAAPVIPPLGPGYSATPATWATPVGLANAAAAAVAGGLPPHRRQRRLSDGALHERPQHQPYRLPSNRPLMPLPKDLSKLHEQARSSEHIARAGGQSGVPHNGTATPSSHGSPVPVDAARREAAAAGSSTATATPAVRPRPKPRPSVAANGEATSASRAQATPTSGTAADPMIIDGTPSKSTKDQPQAPSAAAPSRIAPSYATSASASASKTNQPPQPSSSTASASRPPAAEQPHAPAEKQSSS